MRVSVCVFMYFIVFAERLPHFLKLDLQLVTVALAELGPAHLLGGGEGVERLVEEEDVLLIQGVRGDIRDVPTTHLVRQGAESIAMCYIVAQPQNQNLHFARVDRFRVQTQSLQMPRPYMHVKSTVNDLFVNGNSPEM